MPLFQRLPSVCYIPIWRCPCSCHQRLQMGIWHPLASRQVASALQNQKRFARQEARQVCQGERRAYFHVLAALNLIRASCSFCSSAAAQAGKRRQFRVSQVAHE